MSCNRRRWRSAARRPTVVRCEVTLESRFKFGDLVSIDGGTITGRVIGFCFYPHDHQIQVSWWSNGTLVEQWLGAWRLKLAE